MLEDGRKVEAGATLAFDVCVIGAGAAGLTLAKTLDPKLDVCILESGGLERDQATQDLYAGENVGRTYFSLDGCRLRFFGGSTNCWAGMCRPLEADDFAARDWVPHSGWPITRADLDPYYARAHELLDLGPFDYDPDRWGTGAHRPFPLRPDSPLRSGVFQVNGSDSRVLGRRLRKDVESAANVRVLLWSNVTEIVLEKNGAAVDHLAVRSLDGAAFRVEARHVILAAGGLENPRLLLASRSVREAGVGNEHDLVGRYFMEHPHTDFEGALLVTAPDARTAFYRTFRPRDAKGPMQLWGYLTVTPEAQRKERMLAFASVLLPFDDDERKKLDPLTLRALAGFDDSRPQSLERKPVLWWLGTPSEQAPNPESRVTLADGERDALGMPRLKLDWRLSEIDKRSLRRAHELIAQEVGAGGIGRLQLTLPDGDVTWPEGTGGGRHHMGTTRMHADPKRGVVDANGTVHGIANLSIAGSSVFTTSGASNPTLTLVALAMRLADRLGGELLP